MDSMYYCGMSFCVSYYQDRCPVYPDPYFLCAYHGLETDLVNLTACWGYELWRFSTTCTLVIESVKATSVVFLLGVGSLVCYKLYSHYRKKIGGPSSSSGKKRLRLLKWGSEELIESNADLDSDLQNIETKYFGPEETNTEDATECSEVDIDECLSFVESPSPGNEELDETLSELSDIELDMGNLIECQYQPVAYNVREGIIFPNDLLAGAAADLPPVSPELRHKTSFLSLRPRRHRKCRRFDFGALLEGQREKKTQGGGCIDECDSKSKSSCVPSPDECREELLHSQNGSDADVESLGSPSLVNWDSDLDDVLGKEPLWNQDSDTASLNANFSLHSLQERSCMFDRSPPDGADGADPQLLHESVSSGRWKEAFIGDGNPEIPSKSLRPERRPETLASGRNKKDCLVRDPSFDSDLSEISLDIALPDIGSSTLANIDHLLNNLHQVKQSCLNLDEEIVSLKAPQNSHPVVKSSTSSERSERSVSRSGSAMDIVETHKCRASFKGLLESSAFIPDLSDRSTADAPSVSSDSRAATTAASLEWESPVLMSSRRASKNTRRTSVRQNDPNAPTMDSGSDFGTPLDSESPDPTSSRHFSSSPSLEWDEEFAVEEQKDETIVDVGKHWAVPEERRRLHLHLSVKGSETQEYTLCDSLPNTSDTNPVPKFQMLCDLTPENADERIVPGQSRDCSPGDVATNDGDVKNYLVGDALSEIPEEKVPMIGPQWASTESGFGDDAGISKRSDSEKKATMRRKEASEERNANRDSAYYDDADLSFPRFQENVGEKWDIIQYCESEWKGHTNRAKTIRNGYMAIPDSLGCHHIRRIRGDNYCAIRATLFQVLSHKIPILDKKLNGISNKLRSWVKKKHSWLKEWSFANRLPYSKETCAKGFHECLKSLQKFESLVESTENADEWLVKEQNADSEQDVQLMEAVKLLMMKNSIELFDDMNAGKDVPTFVILMYARETADCPRSFMTNHMNLLGDSGGLEQVDMFLLGYTLGVTLQVVRPSCFGESDYITQYAESNEEWPLINLIAEDDRHYNIIVS